MKTRDFHFVLPPELIAQVPLATRSDSRLLVYHRDTQQHQHAMFHQLASYLRAGDLLVMNDTRVVPARLFGYKATGGRVELLMERKTGPQSMLTHIKASKSPRPSTTIQILDGDQPSSWTVTVEGRVGDLYQVSVNGDVDQMLDELGHIPLPPYITRDDDVADVTRYQTIYARHRGSVAAPTAGLHFDDQVMEALQAQGIGVAYVTLHVGAGTFQPVRVDNVADHVMHSEHFAVTQELADAIHQTKAAGHRVIAVGTTALRCLESAARLGPLKACSGDTDIFITPGYTFAVCDGLITNFHLPESTLLMLVSAFIGYESAMALYKLAIDSGYRFFSYGDVSLLL